MKVYESKPGAYPRTRHIYVVGEYDSERITYREGYAMGSAVLFDSRKFVMDRTEFETNFERCGNDD